MTDCEDGFPVFALRLLCGNTGNKKKRLLTAIRERDPVQVKEAMLNHVDYAENYFISR